ncbi:hypothetical protein EDB81DRAFT_760496 [Dactylonectria macrodidyma]|uniref:PD-(D/E)XK nuclease-like domain-containing protein n=1 Tax=Dactylonectria macrodidyma TaxID=307937 RepID=A0A9P9J379_9HYPO|nr:hypothetical protein EDB81DRAFT_760496 [Dactylonectria macrodidyma]
MAFDTPDNQARLVNSIGSHTDFYPLRNRLIALSIETKKPGESWEKAKLQLGIWESASWAFLRHLFSKCQGQVFRVESATEHQDNAPAPLPSLPGLPEFLPGIIVQGHAGISTSLLKEENEQSSGKGS